MARIQRGKRTGTAAEKKLSQPEREAIKAKGPASAGGTSGKVESTDEPRPGGTTDRKPKTEAANEKKKLPAEPPRGQFLSPKSILRPV